jgi:2-keto-4-pentenoate hydratase/2-oxohepta-3-ene-1,7-dioic acid hydratase in catechol pathway
MKLLSYIRNGNPSYGALIDGGVLDLRHALEPSYPALAGLLEAGLAREALRSAAGGEIIPLDEIQFLPPIPESTAIFCVGINYADHAQESGRALPPHPSTFLKLARSLVGHRQPLVRPIMSDRLDWEAELAVVIGRHARHVTEDEALSCVAGYTCFNDGSIRDWQLQRDVTQGKNFLASGACGPWLVTADDIPDPRDLLVISRLNGEEMQRSSTKNLIFSVPKLVSYYSSLTQLRPGDIISTGTPGGVGHRRNPPIFMKPGDVIEVEVEGVGVLTNTIVDE